jgi:two-component SAPR family response regulator
VKHDAERLAPILAAARQAVGEERFAVLWSAGRAYSVDQALTFAVQESTAIDDVRSATHAGAKRTTRAESVPLDVRALGRVEIFREGARLENVAWRYARPRELLLYLLAQANGRTREQIGLVFWPDASATQVKNNFHVMLHHVRKAIGRADLIAFEKDRYRIAWELGVRLDARTFEEMMRGAVRELKAARRGADSSGALARIDEAMSLYRGDFLAEEGAGDWHVEIRDRLRRLYSEGVLLLGAQRLETGAYKEAAEAFRRAIAVDELHEDAHRRLMLSLARGGERTEALRQYDRLARTLRADLEAEPEPATRALYDRLKKAEPV